MIVIYRVYTLHSTKLDNDADIPLNVFSIILRTRTYAYVRTIDQEV